MKLYIDLSKAVQQVPNTSVDTPTEDQSVAEYHTSFKKRPAGVASGDEEQPDDPKVGASWKHGSGESSVKKKVSKNFFAVTSEEETQEPVEKGVEILKSLNSRLVDERRARMPNAREQEFLRDVLGYSQEDINKGVAVITGRNRSLFSKWLCDRLSSSTVDLMKSVGVDIG